MYKIYSAIHNIGDENKLLRAKERKSSRNLLKLINSLSKFDEEKFLFCFVKGMAYLQFSSY